MKYGYLSLTNYIGIYNGMGIYEIAIDFSKCKNRIVVIRGDNGSGKSTIEKALNVFPDNNECFIPGMPAKKEIVLVDGLISYKLIFIHNIKTNGERETTKAYISKIENGIIKELNPNGNVSSYKDILYDELLLDPNFIALSQLSLDDRGLADKRPAERKRFVNSIIESLEVYNDIYKILTKKSSGYKSMINSLMSKLGSIGDINELQKSLDDIENRINIKNNDKDTAVASLAYQNSIISLLDPDGKIRSHFNEVSNQKNQVTIALEKMRNLLQSKMPIIFSEDSFSDETIKNIENKIFVLQTNIDGIKDKIVNLMNISQEEAQYLMAKSNRLASITNSSNYDELVFNYSSYMDRLTVIKEELKQSTNIEPGSISKAEFIIALETLKELDNTIFAFKDAVDYNTLDIVLDQYYSGVVDPAIGYSPYIPQTGDKERNRINEIEREIISIEESKKVTDKLVNRPKKCKIDDCYFIKDAVDFMNTDPDKRLEKLNNEKKMIEEAIEKDLKDQEHWMMKQSAIRYIYQIIQQIRKNGEVLHKIGIFDTPKDLFDGILSGKSFQYMQDIYKQIDMANLFDEYINIEKIANNIKSEIDILDTKKDMIDGLVHEIEILRNKLNHIEYQLDLYRRDIYVKESEKHDLEGILSTHIECNRIIREIKKYENMIIEYDKELASIEDKTNKITGCFNEINRLSDIIKLLSNEIGPMMIQRDKLFHNIETAKEYMMELEVLKGDYNYIEKIKYYTSPTTGIQLVFMELYMGKIIGLSNELLGLLFNGTYKIQPFIINETEFRIPCLGEGYLNDDISSMSSAQISMISMILSFSLLYHSSTRYNIIKLDEIDGPLDEGNRIMFIDVLNKIMDIMGTEQCIMISHNSELQMDFCDIIQLRSINSIPDYTNNNIIWKY